MADLSSVPLPLWIALGAVLLVALAALLRRPQTDDGALRDALARAEARVEALESQIDAQSQTVADQRADIVALEAERRDLEMALTQTRERGDAALRAANDKLQHLEKLRDEMTVQFRDLAQTALHKQGEALAKTHVEKLHTTLTPLREHVSHFEKQLKGMHEASHRERIELRKEIEALAKQTTQISQDAVALTRALKSDQQKQGAWGEMVLDRVLEASGLREGEEYTRQAARSGEDGGRLRPDVVVNIPGGKTLVIDSKVSLAAYSDLVNATDDAESASAAKRHLASLKTHIAGLSGKAYHSVEDNSVDYVILFVPIEGALSEALRLDGALTTDALEKHVTIATPTTLMMALKTVAHVWAVERRNRNAEEIAKRAGLLYDKVAGFVGNMEQVGARLDQAQKSFESAFDQLSRGRGNVLGQVDTLKALGAKTTKRIETDFDPEPDVHALSAAEDSQD
jgi:DNA recombination protein RmuC